MDEWYEEPEIADQVQEMIEMSLYDAALELLDRYGSVMGDEWEKNFLYGRIWSEQDEPEKALSYLKNCYRLDRANPDSLLAIFYAYAQMGKIDKGGKYLEKARSVGSDHELIINAYLWYEVERGHFAEACELYEKNKTVLAYNPEALRNAGIAYEYIGNFDKALICYKTALELSPEADELRDLLSDHYLKRGAPEKCVEIYREHIKTSPKNIRSLSRLVFCLTQAGKVSEAEEIAISIINTYPNSPVGYVDYSYLCFNTGNVRKAIELADKALDVAPLDAEAYRVKAIAAAEMNEDTEAEKLFTHALSLAPENAEIRRDYYNYLRTVDRFDEMEKQVLDVIRTESPDCLEDYWFLADYYRDKGENRKSFKYLIKAFRLMPGEKELLPPMAEILIDLKHFSFTFPILKSYVESRGWDTMMEELRANSKLKSKWSQEGMRFLQFYSQKTSDYRKYVFMVYVRKALTISLIMIFTTLLLLSLFYFGLTGGLVFVIGWGLSAFITGRLVDLRKKIGKKGEARD